MQCLADGIARRGKANLGDKTMLDVWLPAAQAAQAAAKTGRSAPEVAQAAARVAHQAAQGTTSMIAVRGRAARLNERSLGKLDPGAASAAILIQVFADLERGPA
jgi:dihydroxyacetone kinase-like protein